MTDDEFRKKMAELGWNNDYADEIIESRKQDSLAGFNPPPFEEYLVEAPISD